MDDEGSLSQSRKANELGQAPHACELKHAFNSIRSSFWYVGVFSGAVNILMLTGALFMLEVYDRVLPSQSFPTLLALAILVLILLSAQGLLDVIRNRMLVRLGNEFTRRLETRAIDLLVRLPLRSDRSKGMSNPIAELDVIRSFIGGPGLTSLFDLPWIPVYLAVIYALHPWLGWTAIAGAAVLIGLTLVTEMCSRQSVAIGARANSQRNQLAAAMSRNSEAVVTMAMLGNMTSRWQQANHEYAVGQRRTSDISMGLGSLSKTLRLMLQSMVLAVGAFLVIRQEASAGVIIAGAILTARALAPVDMAIGQWKAFVAARQSWQRLKDLLDLLPPTIEPMILPAPSRTLELQRVSTTPPGDPRLVVHDINAILHRGQGLGIVGPSGSGKSSLVRLIVGLWPPVRGRLLLDNAELHNWSTEHLGHHIGYLPQSVELFEGSVAENIARFAPDADAEDIIAAARTAGVHELIMTFPEGYETNVGEQGSLLSVGQRQRIALARALFRDPFLVVLDEPNSNLDAEGDLALQMAMKRVRARGGIVVMVAHRAAALNSVDIVLAIRDGKALAYGPRDEVLSQIKSNHQQTAISQIRVVPEADQVRDRSTGDVQ
ncbi:MAG: type I secretion system permease/ATPase [Pseudomonadota bacterium]